MNSSPGQTEFSIVDGGPLHRLQLRLGFMKQQAPRIARRAVIFALVAWLPLLILSALHGVAIRNVKIPFLYDPAAYSRFLLAVPLLIVAEIVIGPRIAAATSQFITSGLVGKDHYPDFDAAMADGLRLRDSIVAEVIILVITYIGAFESLRIFSTNFSTWNSLVSGSDHRLTLAGYWYTGVASDFPIPGLPVALESIHLVQLPVAHVQARFAAGSDPPGSGRGTGLFGRGESLVCDLHFRVRRYGIPRLRTRGSLRESASPVLPNSHCCICCHESASLPGTAVHVCARPVGDPAKGLARVQYAWSQAWAPLSSEVGEGDKSCRRIIAFGAPDNTSLANYSHDYELVDRMRIFPFEPRTVVALALAGLLPIVPLLATVMPMAEIFKLLLKVLG